MKKIFLLLITFVSFFASASELHDKQVLFAKLEAALINHATKLGYEVTLGEAWRSQAMAKFSLTASIGTPGCPMCVVPTKWYADHGKGIADSLHILRLAIDINLFKNGKFLTKKNDYQPLGEWWEKQCKDCSWGGRFKKLSDANHFSVSYGGVK